MLNFLESETTKSQLKQTPVEQQYYSLKKQHFDKILMFQMGDFYEIFGKDAQISANVLKIQLTSRNKNKQNSLPMCGFPLHSSEHYIHKLVIAGYKIALCRQIGTMDSKGLMKREVVRIITPGTILNDEYLHSEKNNYLACLFFSNEKIGVSYCDFSTGEFLMDCFSKHSFEELINSINLKQPAEILVADDAQIESKVLLLKQKLEASTWFVTEKNLQLIDNKFFNYQNCSQSILEKLELKFLNSIGLENSPEVVCALGGLMCYLQQIQVNKSIFVETISWVEKKTKMLLDSSTIEHLSLFNKIETNSKIQSLFHLLNQNSTSMGSRMLRQWVSEPLINLEKILQRQTVIKELIEKRPIQDEVGIVLKGFADLERLVTKITLGHFRLTDFVKIRNSLKLLPTIKELLLKFDNFLFKDICRKWDSLIDLLELLTRGIVAEPPSSKKKGDYIADGFCAKLDEWRKIAIGGKMEIQKIENLERSNSGIQNLKIRYIQNSGFFIEISKTNRQTVPANYIRKQTLTNSERFTTENLREIEEEILSANEEIIILEEQQLQNIVEQLCFQKKRILKIARLIAAIDCFQTLAKVCFQRNYVQPEFFPIETEQQLEILGARHPLIEANLTNESFIANDLMLSQKDKYIQIITGPNMGGKTTYMRQIALIILMAQIGLFVPATKAKISIFRQIFTRVGASDNILKGESTFMVEMNEAATILKYSNQKTFIILDEIGRGTSTYDGVSIAWSILEFLHSKKIITLFATHYHELVKLEKDLEGVVNTHVITSNQNQDIVFLKKIKPGFSNQSYGIHVAKIAGLPDNVIKRSKQILKQLEQKKKFDSLKIYQELPINFNEETPNKYDSKLKEQLDSFDIENSTPLSALNFLQKLKQQTKDSE